ncbi:hypothetical protein [Allofranklinella schreckenbergeri]|uniref:hypothetical protein n=1 Tax=Allofranklinella schreckenbergeri TaxID=1076744 RepID=UPI001EEEC120|nr:hypothetical protein [Allofranklinella schreckenbergeri]
MKIFPGIENIIEIEAQINGFGPLKKNMCAQINTGACTRAKPPQPENQDIFDDQRHRNQHTQRQTPGNGFDRKHQSVLAFFEFGPA